ncbi:MAG: tetratricopeptide repeat protein [Desulfosarcina sp.]|nr:tetratricopeptide repeat protein [Desulfosarcina sp.]
MTERYDRALSYYQKAVTVNPQFPEALNNMAATLNILGKYGEAVDCCNKAIEIRPNYSEPFNNMGNAYKALGKLGAAIACYEKSMTMAEECAEVLCNLANALQEKGELDEAIANYEKAIKLNPSYGKAYNNFGTALRSKRKLKEAELNFRQSITLLPNDAEAYHNLGNVCYDKGDFGSAASWYDKAISINSGSVQTLINRGIIYQETCESDRALDCFNKALELDPQNSKAHSHMVHELYHRCEWRRIDDLNATIDKWTERELAKGNRPNEMPFLSLIRTADPLANFRVAERWSQEISKNIIGNKGSVKFNHERPNSKKITIGYLSNNFRNHPTSHLISDIFDLHDRNRFAINAYSYGEDDNSLYRENIKQQCDAFVDLRNSIHKDAAQHIFNDQVDILVDLVGYMRGNRLEICAYRPAPVQVRWLGLAGTTGAMFFDYIISDNTVIPDHHAIYYSEKLVHMPNCYQVNSKPLKKTGRKFSRSNSGLPEGVFVYCCFCSNYKIDPVIFKIWMNILKSVPESVLWLLKSNSIVEENLKREASKCGINPERLVFAEKMVKADHLERIKLADLGLDTRIVNGAATTSDSLFSCVPVIALKGKHFASRMAASIIKAVGLNDLVTENLSDYKELAITLGKNPEKYDAIQKRLKANLILEPLFDTSRFVGGLEKAYTKMWERYLCGKKPEMIRVGDNH